MTLAQDIITDLDIFMNPDEFGSAAVYTPSYTEYPAKNITAIQLGYPTILTSVAHGFVAGVTVVLAGFTGDDRAEINGFEYDVLYITDDTFAIDLNTTDLDITVAATTATPSYPDAVSTNVLFNKADGALFGMEGTRIWIEGKTSVFASAKPGETIAIGGVTYKIKGPPIHADGTSKIELSID